MTADEERQARFALDVLRSGVVVPTSVALKAQQVIAKAVGVAKPEDDPIEKVEKLISERYYSGQNAVAVIDVLQAIHGIGAGFAPRPSTGLP